METKKIEDPQALAVILALLGFIGMLWGSHIDVSERLAATTDMRPWIAIGFLSVGAIGFFIGMIYLMIIRLKERPSFRKKALFCFQILGIGAFFIFFGAASDMLFLSVSGGVFTVVALIPIIIWMGRIGDSGVIPLLVNRGIRQISVMIISELLPGHFLRQNRLYQRSGYFRYQPLTRLISQIPTKTSCSQLTILRHQPGHAADREDRYIAQIERYFQGKITSVSIIPIPKWTVEHTFHKERDPLRLLLMRLVESR